MLSKIFLLSLLLVCTVLFIPTSNAATIANTLSIQKAPLQFIDFSKYASVEKLYDNWDLTINFESQTQVQLNKNWKKLEFENPGGNRSWTWIISIGYKDIKRNILVYVNITEEIPDFSNIKDFNLFSQMPFHRLQERSLSCESSAASDILSYLTAKNISEDEIVDLLPKSDFYNKLPEQRDIWKVWWNPNTWFVWYIDHTWSVTAKQSLWTWYGVYEAPIAKIYNSYGFKTEIINNSQQDTDFWENDHLTRVLTELAKGNMVQLWWDWCTKKEYQDWDISSSQITSFKAQDGIISWINDCSLSEANRVLKWNYVNEYGEYVQHEWLSGQHAFVLLWWRWNITNPTHVRVWDTNTGYHEYKTVEWMRKWKAMDFRTLIITSNQKSKT